jgi:hypothetical protein
MKVLIFYIEDRGKWFLLKLEIKNVQYALGILDVYIRSKEQKPIIYF